jgi:phosphoglycerate dehydrogenase-like enzyme
MMSVKTSSTPSAMSGTGSAFACVVTTDPPVPDPAALDQACISIDASMSDLLREDLSRLLQRPVRIPAAAAGSGQPVIHIGPNVPDDLMGRLLWFHSTNAGVDAVLRGRCWPEDVLFTRTVGRMGRRIAEYVLAWMLEERQRVSVYHAQQGARSWQRQQVDMIDGELVVVFGAGRIGRAVAALLRGVGLRVIGVATTTSRVPEFNDVVDTAGALRYVPCAQWLVSTLPLTDGTRDYFSADLFGAARGACFINVGRGGTVHYDALREALEDGRLRRAVLDVLPDEPPARDNPWWDLPRTVITPHTAGVTAESDVAEDFGTCWDSLRRGEPPSLMVDPGRGY